MTILVTRHVTKPSSSSFITIRPTAGELHTIKAPLGSLRPILAPLKAADEGCRLGQSDSFHMSFVPIDYRQFSRAFYDWFKLLIYSFSEFCEEADVGLFKAVTSNPDHVMYQLLPPLKNTPYHLRPRTHNFELPVVNNNLKKNFIHRMLYSNSY